MARAPGNLHTGRPLGDDELDDGLSGEAEPSRAGQRCAPGPRQATAKAAPSVAQSWLPMQSPGPRPDLARQVLLWN